MNHPKKHHYLPQFYLRYFKITPQDTKLPQIWAFPKKTDSSGFRSSIKDTACMADYHSIEGTTGEKDRSTFETAVSKIEYQQEKLIRRILQNKIMNQKDKAAIASFISLMRTRVPSFKSNIEETHKAAVLATSDLAYKHGRLPPPPKVLEPYLKGKTISDIVKVEIANWMLLKYMFDAAINSRFAELLYRMNSTLIECPSSHFFITSDSPVSLYHPLDSPEDAFGKGLYDKHMELFLPLSPTIGILFCWRSGPISMKASIEEVIEFNKRTIITATSYIYGDRTDESVIKQIQKYAGQYAGFKVERIPQNNGYYIMTRYIPVTMDKINS